MISRRSQANRLESHDVAVVRFSAQTIRGVMQQTSRMMAGRWVESFRDLISNPLRRWTETQPNASLHTPEELECFKKDAIENRAKHY